MFKGIFLAAVFAISLSFAAKAQDDSLYYDLGRVLVKKSATQTVSIKGRDLEKYQASNLSDAINVWLYGTYTNNASIIYVIDGNIITDVNTYSIYDIEEVTLVQTAVAQSSGAKPGQQMVLIKTRTNRSGKKGIEATGQSSQVSLRNQANTPGVTSTSNTYDQYYVAGYRNYKNVNMGVTAEYQRDVDPSFNGNGFELLQPAHYNRIKLYAYANAKLWKGSTLIFGANYVPQTNNYSYNLDTLSNDVPAQDEKVYYMSHVSQHLLGSHIGIKSDLAKGLTNRFSVAYNHYNYFESDSTSGLATTSAYTRATRVTSRSHNMLIRDYLSYFGKLGNFNITSILNITYRNFEDSSLYQLTSLSAYNGNPPVLIVSPVHYGNSYKNFMASPSVDIFYKDFFNLQGGFLVLVNSGKAAADNVPINHIYPFFTTTLDLAKMTGIPFVKWRLFASFSRQSPVIADDYSTLSGFNLSPAPGTKDFFLANFRSFQQFNSYQAGTTVGVLKNLTVNYSYEFKYSSYLSDVPVLNANGALAIPVTAFNGKTVTNRFALNYIMNTPNFNWSASLNGTESQLQVLGNTALAATYNAQYLSVGHRWTGGYTNRFDYKIVFWGVDLLYQAGQRPTDLINAFATAPGYLPPSNNNSITVQNFYFGTRIKIPHVTYAEVYANSRNLLQNSSSTITDGRRFYGLGFKAGL